MNVKGSFNRRIAIIIVFALIICQIPFTAMAVGFNTPYATATPGTTQHPESDTTETGGELEDESDLQLATSGTTGEAPPEDPPEETPESAAFGITATGIDLFSASPGNQPAKIVADNHNLMLRADGRLLGWGDNTYGQLGLGAGAPTKVYTPTEITFFADKGLKIKDIAVIEDASFVLCSNGETYSTGKGLNGRLGLGDTANRNEWTLIPGSAELRFNKLYPGKEFIDVTSDDNKIYSWGRNTSGQVGNGTKSDVLTPVKIMDNADVRELDVGEDFVTLIKQDNSYWSWGNNASGRYGFDTSASKSSSVVTAGTCSTPTPTPCTYHGSGFSCFMHQNIYPKHETCGGSWALTEAAYQGPKEPATMTVTLNSFVSPQKVVTGAGRVFTALSSLSSTWNPSGTADGITNNINMFRSTASCTHNHNKSSSPFPECLPITKSSTRAYTHTWQYVLPNAFNYFDTSVTFRDK